jgi:hypothetical protein
MATARATVSRENNVPTASALIRMILVVEHDPARGESFTEFLSDRPHQYVKMARPDRAIGRSPVKRTGRTSAILSPPPFS